MKIISIYQFICFLFFPIFVFSQSETKTKLTPNMFVISIGIDKYNGHSLSNCVNDAKAILNKITIDNKGSYYDPTIHYKFQAKSQVKIDQTYTYGLYDEMATVKNVKEAFKEIIKKSKPNDFFVLFYAGLSLPLKDIESAFVLFQERRINYDNPKANDVIKISELASLMNQISCKNQLIISESCYGKASSQKLMSYMFESDPLFAINNDRNRIIITVSEKGYDSSVCDKNHAPLASYILDNINIIHAFKNIEAYEFNLQKSQIECPSEEKTYFIVRNENDFRDLLLNNYKKVNYRGSKPQNVKNNNIGTDSVISYALLIANDTYDAKADWDDLKNPINDVKALSKVLKSNYNIEPVILHNKSKNDILKEINNLKSSMDENDQFLVFIAGHGYYSTELSDGLIVCKESKELNDDYAKSSYLKMADMRPMLDNAPANNVFVVLDICFGATFDIIGEDIAINSYKNTQLDIGIKDFIDRKNKGKSRIFMASGRYEVPDYWVNSKEHSPFASKLIKAFSEEKEFISPGKIFSYMEGNATEPLLKKFGAHEPRGDFLLKVDETQLNIKTTR